MNKNSNTTYFSSLETFSKKSFVHFLKNILFINGIWSFEISHNNKQYNEKLPIVYANIRV
jgi:hypothetical protein